MDQATARKMKSGEPVTHAEYGSGTWGYRSIIDGPTAAWIKVEGQAGLTLVDYTQVEPGKARIGCQTWDWKDSVDLDGLARDLAHVSGGTIFLYKTDTGRDDNGYVLSDRPLTPAQVREAEEATYVEPYGEPA